MEAGLVAGMETGPVDRLEAGQETGPKARSVLGTEAYGGCYGGWTGGSYGV